MSLGENICAAFDIVAKTYENVNKLMDYCRSASSERGEFALAFPKFLRWKSDMEPGGWYISSFILLFQNAKDPILKNKWRNGPVYVLEISLHTNTVPTVNIAKFEYADIQSWNEGCSPSNHWIFYNPCYNKFADKARQPAVSCSVLLPKLQ